MNALIYYVVSEQVHSKIFHTSIEIQYKNLKIDGLKHKNSYISS